MKLDEINSRIIEFLGTVNSSNLSELTLKSHARESQKVFRERIRNLEANGYVKITMMNRTYNIKLNRNI